jgi:hypothetical protein
MPVDKSNMSAFQGLLLISNCEKMLTNKQTAYQYSYGFSLGDAITRRVLLLPIWDFTATESTALCSVHGAMQP